MLFSRIFLYLFYLVTLFAGFSDSDLTVMNPRFRTHVRTKQEVVMGDRLKLRCAAVGKPRPYVHWYRNNELVSSSSASKNRIKLSGTSMLINRVEPGDEGNYACKVWNQIGQIWRNFTVIIIDSPQWRQQMYERNQQTAYNDRNQLEKWLGEPIDNKNNNNNRDISEEEDNKDDEHKPETTKDLDKMPMNDGQPDHSRPNYTYTPRDYSLNNELAYERAPYWAKPESEMLQTVFSPAGRQVKLACRANGKPEPLVIWFKNGVEIKAESERVIGYKYSIKKWALVLEDVVPSDKGIYTCRAFNKYGTISHNYSLDIVERLPVRPIIAPEYPKNATVFVGDNATFECPVLSDLQPYIEWVRHCKINGSYQDEQGDPCLEKVISDVREVYDGMDEEYLPRPMVLVMNNVTLEDEGWYTCIAGNQLGINHRSAWLTVLQRNDSMLIERLTEFGPSSGDGYHVAIFITTAFLIVIALIVIAVCVYMRYNQKKIHYRNSLDESMSSSPFAPIKKVVKIYRNESSLSECTLVPTITVTPRYHSRLSSDLSVHYDYEIPLDPAWEVQRDDLSLLISIGEGAFGQVYRGTLKTDKAPNGICTVAVKMLKQSATDRELIDLVSEMEVMKQIGQHMNIINLVGCCTQNGPLYVIVEYCANGNLLNFLREQRPESANKDNYEEPNSKRISKKVLTTQSLVQFAFQVAKGMKYLSDKKCIHRDLAARNVLVTEELLLKIGDFGLARDVTEFDYYRKQSDGRLPVKWMAPEALFDRKYTVKSDVWSYGVLLWEIMTLGGKPYPSVPLENLYQLLKKGHRMSKPHNCPNEIYFVMTECWQDNPEKRWSFAEIVKYLDDILVSAACEEYIDVVSDDLPPAQDSTDETPLQEFDSESVKNRMLINENEKQSLANDDGDEKPSSPADPLLYKPATDTVASAALMYLKKQSPMPSPIRTALRPISEISELSDDRFRMDIDDDDDPSRPSATDSGNPSSPGGSFEGSSDSVDSKDSLPGGGTSRIANGGTDCRQLKRHSDPLDNSSAGIDIRVCDWVVPKNRIKTNVNISNNNNNNNENKNGQGKNAKNSAFGVNGESSSLKTTPTKMPPPKYTWSHAAYAQVKMRPAKTSTTMDCVKARNRDWNIRPDSVYSEGCSDPAAFSSLSSSSGSDRETSCELNKDELHYANLLLGSRESVV